MQQNRTHSLYGWQEAAGVAAAAHRRAAFRLRRYGWWLAIPATVLAAVVGTTIFATLENNVSIYIRIAAGTISIAAAILTSLQGVLRFAERAEMHRTIAAEYRSIEMEITTFLDDYNASDSDISDKDARATIHLIRKRFDEVNARAPELDPRDDGSTASTRGRTLSSVDGPDRIQRSA